MQETNRLRSPGAITGAACEPRSASVPRTLNSLHTSLDGLSQQITQLADRLQSVLSSSRPQGAAVKADVQSTGCEVSDSIHGADEKVETLRGAIDDLMGRLQV